MDSLDIPQTQTVALVRDLGGTVEFKTDYLVPTPGRNEVLAKVLYTGVCQSGKYLLPFITRTKLTKIQTCTQNPEQPPAPTETRLQKSNFHTSVDMKESAESCHWDLISRTARGSRLAD
jgi:hypothetical protein